MKFPQSFSAAVKAVIATLLLLISSVSFAAWQSWPAVGDARLKWGPWVIYDSELRTPTGLYRNDVSDIALVIKYQRNINKDDLLKATDQQWEHLGIALNKRRQWLAKLDAMWPDVKKGDRLIFVIRGENGFFYQDNLRIGIIEDKEMSLAFINIWLSPETAYPTIRSRLIGNV
ncbi:chalcone isomerase family protein [Photobacterium sp. J15]|uniref:chalcone isomerase family protein n=1 Tax=Photobacterium sp. J15 TaxID=265901 RepID=UPI0007E4B63F|nr:chalcone isomerase family protein [Photobacterium sp. J15]